MNSDMTVTPLKNKLDGSITENDKRADLVEQAIQYPINHTRREIRSSVQTLPAILKERTILVVAGALCLLTVFNLIRGSRGVSYYQYQAIRNRWQGVADIVFAGDSRTQFSVCPQAVQQGITARALNYACGGLQYNSAYFDRLRRIVDPHSSMRQIVFGITPVNFFAQEMIEEDAPVATSRMEPMLHRIMPALFELTNPFFAAKNIFHPDGWVYSLENTETLSGVTYYRDFLYAHNQVSQAKINLFLDEIRQMVQEGYHPCAYRAPASDELFEVDTRYSGFNYALFRQQFIEAGGRWLEAPQSRWKTIDGIHMQKESAESFSRELGKILADQATDERYN